jgi:hypothetical protein
MMDGFNETGKYRKMSGFPQKTAETDIYIKPAQANVTGVIKNKYRSTLDVEIISGVAGEFFLAGNCFKRQPVTLKNGVNQVKVVDVYFDGLGKNFISLQLLKNGHLVAGRSCNVQVEYEPLRVKLSSPAYRDTFYPGEKSDVVKGVVTLGIADPVKLEISIDDKPARTIAVKDGKTAFSLPVPQLADGEHSLNFKLTAKNGKTVVKKLRLRKYSKAPANRKAAWIVNGQLVEGKMVWKHTDWSINEFTGRFSNYLNVGARKLVSKDGGRQERHVGSFVNGAQDGEGSRKIVALHDVIDISGTYAYGKMYGKGQFKRVSKNDGNGIRSTEIYNGDFFADTFHGNGRMTVSLSDIPAGSWTFTRCNVKLPSVVAASMEIVMEGIFESGAFVSGRVSYSDGSWFEGTFTSSGLAQGRMLRKYSDGSWYEGECKDGKCDGYGVIHYQDGTIYEGMFKDGRPVNAGIAKPQDDEGMPEVDYSEERTFSYAEANLSKGQARLITPAGVKMILRVSSAVDVVCKGRFEKNIMVEGRATSSEGTWVEGRFEDGVLVQGRGRTTDKYGTIYEGDIRNGYPHGAGKCTYSDGTSFKGYFANGNRMSGTHYAADGSVIKVYD